MFAHEWGPGRTTARREDDGSEWIDRAGVVAAYAIARHAERAGQRIAAEWDTLVDKVFPGTHLTANPYVQSRLLELLPEPRAAALRPRVYVWR